MKMKLPCMVLLSALALLSAPANAMEKTKSISRSKTLTSTEAPAALDPLNVRNTIFSARWTAVAGADSYRIDVSTTPFGQNASENYVYQNLQVGNVTYYTVTGLDPAVPYYYRVRAVSEGDTSENSNTVSVLTTAVTSWNGLEWSDQMPTASINARIEGNYDTAVNGTFTCKTLTVAPTGHLVLRSGTNMTVVGSVINNGTPEALVIESNANLLQLADSDANAGNITVYRTAMMRRLDYVYWSSPVASQNLQAFSPQTLPNRFYVIDEANNNFMAVDHVATDFVAGKGYSVRAPDNFDGTPQIFTGKFVGVPWTGNVSLPVSVDGQGYNLIGNPYPSTINVDAFLSANPGISTLYFWTHTQHGAAPGANYATVNATGGTAASETDPPSAIPNGTIQVGQGFVAKANVAGTANFTNAMRVADNADQFFRASRNGELREWFDLSGPNGYVNQILVGYVAGATDLVDAQYDAVAMSNAPTRLYSLISDDTAYVIQGKASAFDPNDLVRLGISAETPGHYTISLSHTDGPAAENQHIFLKDQLTGQLTDLTTGVYNFTTTAGTFNERFVLQYQNNLLAVDGVAKPDTIVAYAKDGQIYLDTTNDSIESVSIYDLGGRLLYRDEAVGAPSMTIGSLSPAQRLLLVRVTTNNGVVTTKKLLF